MRGLSFTLAAALGVATTLPFHSVPLFNLTSHLGPVSGPITVEGGEQIAFPIVSGTIIGPSMAGVITGGLTVSTVYSNGSYFSSDTTYYGSLGNTTFTAQGSAIHHSENGSPGQEVQRLTFKVGAPYEDLTAFYILGASRFYNGTLYKASYYQITGSPIRS